MSTILIGVDGSDRSAGAITFGAQVPATTRIVATAYQRDRSAALATATAAAASLPGAPRVHAVTGASTAAALHALAVAEGADLVIVGATHTGRFARVVPGATGERLLQGAPYAVAVVPRGYRAAPVEQIGVAYDTTPEADAALAAAAELARALNESLEVIGVVPPDFYETPGFVDGRALSDLLEDAERRVDATLEDVVRELPYGIRARHLRLAGRPVEVLADHSRRLDLLVTGTRGYGRLRAVLTGAVSGRVQRRAACPVITVPQDFSGRIASAIRIASPSAMSTAASA